MAKTNKEAILKLSQEINKKEGEGAIYSLGSSKAILRIPRWSTGITDLDNIIGGGMPEGRVIEIYGGESAGKTTLAYHLCGLHELCLDIPIEGCVDCDTEYFNGVKWKKISDFTAGERVLQYNKNGTATLEYPKKFHVYNSNALWHVTSQRLDMCISEYHNVVYRTTGNGEIKIKPFHDIRLAMMRNKEGFCGNIPKTFEYSGKGINLTEWQIRLMVAVFADGSFPGKESCQCCFGIKKKRKIKRLEMLLAKNNIKYRKRKEFYIFGAPMREKHYPLEWYNMSKEQLEIVLDEMKHWDGCQFEKGHMPSFSTTSKRDADFIQFAYTATGYAAYITVRDRRGTQKYIKDHWIKSEKVSYNVCSGVKSKIVSLRKGHVQLYHTKDGKMYCFTMKSGMWVMRRNNKIIVTGNTFDASRAKVFGNRPKQMLIYRANYGEDAFNKAIKYAQLGIPLIVFDSVPSMQPREDVEKILKAVDKDAEIETRIGGIARLMTKYLPVLESVIEQTGTTVIFINQIRDKMGMMNPFGDTETTPGGHKLKHACSLRIKVARKQWIEIPNKNPLNTATKEKIGLIMKCKIVKSKVNEPMGECEIPLIFEKGFIEYSDIDTVRKEIMKEHGRKYKEMFG